MDNKKILYQFIENMITTGLSTKEEVLDTFLKILRNHFTPEEMMQALLDTSIKTKKAKIELKQEFDEDNLNDFEDQDLTEENTSDMLSYPSVIGIPINIVYEKIFSKK